ncbi:MAG: hypothetical protein ACLPWS_13505 [Rhodomicrobium sp.]
MRMISTSVAAVFLCASTFGTLAAPAASPVQGTNTGSGAVLVQSPSTEAATMPEAKKPMHRKSSKHLTRRRRHLTSMHHTMRAKTAMHRGKTHRTALRHKPAKAKTPGTTSSTY